LFEGVVKWRIVCFQKQVNAKKKRLWYEKRICLFSLKRKPVCVFSIFVKKNFFLYIFYRWSWLFPFMCENNQLHILFELNCNDVTIRGKMIRFYIIKRIKWLFHLSLSSPSLYIWLCKGEKAKRNLFCITNTWKKSQAQGFKIK
jgi:hypothetical protein